MRGHIPRSEKSCCKVPGDFRANPKACQCAERARRAYENGDEISGRVWDVLRRLMLINQERHEHLKVNTEVYSFAHVKEHLEDYERCLVPFVHS